MMASELLSMHSRELINACAQTDHSLCRTYLTQVERFLRAPTAPAYTNGTCETVAHYKWKHLASLSVTYLGRL